MRELLRSKLAGGRRAGIPMGQPRSTTSVASIAGEFPVVISGRSSALDPVEWMHGQAGAVRDILTTAGAVLFREFPINSPSIFASFVESFSSQGMDYVERAAARKHVVGKVFTSTELAADQGIPLHHEMSYSHNWPSYVFFYCDRPAVEGGETPIARESTVFPRIPIKTYQRFSSLGVLYVRNYRGGLDLSWQEAFQTSNHRDVEAYCDEAGIKYDWIGASHLRTLHRRPAIAKHPVTGEHLWFNHAHLFHSSNLDDDSRTALTQELGEWGLPRNAFYGDGSSIADETMEGIRRLYEENAVAFPWVHGDVLLVDNFLCTHGRRPYRGDRRILVSMTDLFRS